MKNLQILSFAILSLFIFSCNSDDDNSPALNNTNLAGTYLVTAVTGNATETDTSGGTTDNSTAVLVGSDFNNCTITFTEAGMVSSSGTFTLTATIIEDGMVETEVETTDIDIDGSYMISGNSLIVTDNDGDLITIRNFTSAGFQLFFEFTETEPDYVYASETTFTLVRQ